MKVIIAGSRTLHHKHESHYKQVEELCAEFERLFGKITLEVSGCATGPDKIGQMWAANNGIPIAKFPASWDTHGRSAGIVRNKEMGKYADGAIILWDGESKGTQHMYNFIKQLKKPLILKTIRPIIEYEHLPSGAIDILYSSK